MTDRDRVRRSTDARVNHRLDEERVHRGPPRLGVRTRREIDVERAALRAFRGDVDNLNRPAGAAEAVARNAIKRAQSQV